MRKRVLITVGGTGGHVYPAMAVAKELLNDPHFDVLFVGGGLRRNRYFQRETFSYHDISCGTLSFRHPLRSLLGMGRICRGIWQSRRFIQSFSPHVVLGFGSYHTLPTLAAAKWLGVPIILHEANRIPGKVNRLFAPYAALTGVHFPDTTERLKGKTMPIPIPLREGYKRQGIPRDQARTYFELDPQRTTLLIFGGSQGAYAINRLVCDSLVKLNRRELQVLHVTGETGSAYACRTYYQMHGIRATVKEFESRMDLAWQSADLVIARAGAGTLAEQLEFEVPAILIPYPQATDHHQEHNALFMEEQIGGGVMHLEKELTPAKLAHELESFFNNDGERMKTMQAAMRAYKKKQAGPSLCEIIRELVRA